MNRKYITYIMGGLLLCTGSAKAQHVDTNQGTAFPIENQEEVKDTSKKAWELGVGGSLINWNRVAITGFQSTADNYLYNLKANHLMGGVNLYVARELNPWFYVDLQGTVGIGKNYYRINPEDRKHDMLYMGGLGLQFRLNPLFKSRYVEPYLRVGVNYLHKNYQTNYAGIFLNDPTGEAHWESTDTWNPDGRSNDKNSYIPLSFGAGVNAWLNNSFGLGLQGEYLMPLEKSLPRFAQVSLRLMWRIGGKSKRTAPVIQYVEVEKPVERIVERIVEKRVEVQVPVQEEMLIFALLENVHFEFDRDVITAESEKILDRMADLLKRYPNSRFVITAYTDAKGSDAYNMNLSKRRAKAVYEALIGREVPSQMLKWRGVGKRASSIPASGANNVREGDRKVLLEKVTNMEYWEALGNAQ